ncbi:hypothetical protein [Streptomyces sp. NPDC048669]|uniref:hypothetical protein n=1 Tax=Streptomyces sp. NPDC048669 TaxID=3155267 RepID=UPI00343D8405
MAKIIRRHMIRDMLDRWAEKRFLAYLSKLDPLTARRLPYAMDNSLTLDELIALEDEALGKLADTVIENAERPADPSSED